MLIQKEIQHAFCGGFRAPGKAGHQLQQGVRVFGHPAPEDLPESRLASGCRNDRACEVRDPGHRSMEKHRALRYGESLLVAAQNDVGKRRQGIPELVDLRTESGNSIQYRHSPRVYPLALLRIKLSRPFMNRAPGRPPDDVTSNPETGWTVPRLHFPVTRSPVMAGSRWPERASSSAAVPSFTKRESTV